MRIRNMITILGLILVVGVISGVSQTEPPMPPGPPPQRDVLAQLKSALQNAGAPTLTSEQESAILALIRQFREAHQPPAAPPQPDAQADENAQREADLTAFTGNALNILKSDGTQVNALVAGLGESGLEKLIRSLAVGPGRFGRRGRFGRQGGPGGPGGPDGPPGDFRPPVEQ